VKRETSGQEPPDEYFASPGAGATLPCVV
jgi:hypothetical protein